jgi:polysaccharide biosynthesis/export protein
MVRTSSNQSTECGGEQPVRASFLRVRVTAIRRAAVAMAAMLAVSGCARMMGPDNASTALYAPETSSLSGRMSLSFVDTACPPPGTAKFLVNASHHTHAHKQKRANLMIPRFSPGDRINLYVHQSPEFSGDYVVGPQGTITIPYAGDVKAAGLSTAEFTTRVERALVTSNLFRDQEFRVAVRPVQYSSINTTVTGAVFIPGRHTIGFVKEAEKQDKVLTRYGDNPTDRSIATALRAAGGVRPDANLADVRLIREGKTYVLDWRGAILGHPIEDAVLMEGDHIEVGETGCFQSGLVRPSQISPTGIRLYVSNLTVPAQNNNNSANGGSYQLGVPHGTRFLQGLVNANCVGGTLASNASRYGVLISRNPKTMQTEVVQRSIEELVRSPDRDTINPYMMPEDAIACYDSAVTDMREIGNSIQQILTLGLTGKAFRAN